MNIKYENHFQENSSINKLIAEHETPFYFFDEVGFRDNLEHLCSAMRAEYPNYIPAYSYKTNYTPYICSLVKKLGGYAEVVSDMEYYLAKKLGNNAPKIIYNGPSKGEFLEDHLLEGGILNIDHENEAERVIKIAKKYPRQTFKVGIRVNSDIGASFISRFGLELDSEAFQRVADRLNNESNIKIVGLHCHVSQARGLEAWKRRIENMIYAADKYLQDIPEYINLGSGMFANMSDELKKQFPPNIPTYEDYANVVGRAMAKRYGSLENPPILFTEPGTTVVSRYLNLVTRVQSVKIIEEKAFAIVDSSFHNAGEISLMKKMPYNLIRINDKYTSQLNYKTLDVVGYTCLEQDVLYREFPEHLNPSDLIIFGNIGGYSIVSKPPFIQPDCAMYAIHRDGSFSEIKRKESYEDIFKTFTY